MNSKMAHPWKGYTEPFRIFGNLYFVGTVPASTHIIDTGAGLIMIDPGYPQSLYLVIDNMYRLGLDPHDIKIIVITHGHYDHLGAARALVEMTGAKTYIGKEDVTYANGKEDLTWAKELGTEYYEAEVSDPLELRPLLRTYGAYLRILPGEHTLREDLREHYALMLKALEEDAV